MNIYTPILFVLYLQVMPPPPPPDGSDLQSLFTLNDLDGTEIEDGIEYRQYPLAQALYRGPTVCLGQSQYCDWYSIMTGMENGNILLNRPSDL